jgi:hypothetical protein
MRLFIVLSANQSVRLQSATYHSLELCAVFVLVFDDDTMHRLGRALESLVRLQEEIPHILSVTGNVPIDGCTRQGIERSLVHVVWRGGVEARVMTLSNDLVH